MAHEGGGLRLAKQQGIPGACGHFSGRIKHPNDIIVCSVSCFLVDHFSVLFMTLKICVAQLNLVVGDMTGNVEKIVVSARTAYQQGARLVLTPELSICGYAAEDLFLRQAFTDACDDAVKAVALALADLKDLSVVVGHPTGGDQRTRSE